jgi:hypothetical protein
MALDPSIALGIRPLEVPNQLAQYAQMAQVESAQQQNALAQFQLGAARRAEQGQNALGQAYGEFYGGGGAGGAGMGGAPGSVPGAIPYGAMRESIVQKLRTTAPHLIPSELAKISEMEQKALLSRKTQGEIEAQASTQIDKALDLYRKEVPRINDADAAIRFVRAQYADPVIGKIANRFQSLEQTIEETIKEFSTPEGIQKWKIQNAGITGDKLIEMMRETTDKTDLGGQVREQRRDYFGRPIGTPINTQKTATIGDITGQQRLAFDQGKFAWEKANPGFELKEAEDGSIVGVNKRTLQAFPVTIGGAAPAAAPAMPGGGVPGARLPAPSAGPAAPGMAPPAAGAPGVPLMGKGTALTESQGNATAFGLRAKEANSILEAMAKKGTLRGANIEATPFIGESLGKMLPSVLGGTSAAQQQVNQAKSNFITAVLRKESGATILDSEFDREDKKYFPQVNDSDAVIKQKDTARKLAIKAMEYQAGPGAKYIQKYQPSGGIPGASASDPLGLGTGE